MNVDRSHGLVMAWGMMLGEVVSKIVAASIPKYVELPLNDSIADPVVAHVDVARLVLLDGVVGKSSGGGVVGLNWCGGLWVAHVV